MSAQAVVAPRLSAWVRPLAESAAPALAGRSALVVADALLAVATAYARASRQSADDLLAWAGGAWDRCWNVSAPEVRPSREGLATGAALSPEAREVADAWLDAVGEQVASWRDHGSAWGEEIASSQIAALALLVAARACQRTRTSYSGWRAAVLSAWAADAYAVEIAEPEAPRAVETGGPIAKIA